MCGSGTGCVATDFVALFFSNLFERTERVGLSCACCPLPADELVCGLAAEGDRAALFFA